MKARNMSMLKKGDIVLIVCTMIAVIAGFAGLKLYTPNNGDIHKIAVIKYNGQVIKKIDLDEIKKPERIRFSREFDQVVLAEKGRIRFEESDCPDKICVKTGWLTQKGNTAVCVPNKTIIVIEGEEREVDGVTY